MNYIKTHPILCALALGNLIGAITGLVLYLKFESAMMDETARVAFTSSFAVMTAGTAAKLKNLGKGAAYIFCIGASIWAAITGVDMIAAQISFSHDITLLISKAVGSLFLIGLTCRLLEISFVLLMLGSPFLADYYSTRIAPQLVDGLAKTTEQYPEIGVLFVATGLLLGFVLTYAICSIIQWIASLVKSEDQPKPEFA
jgi:hypothetical protein